MNKRSVEALIPKAIELLSDDNCAICIRENGKNSGKIYRAYRSQMSAFGAAVTMGSFLSAVAFFSKDADGEIKRSELISIIYELVSGESAPASVVFSKISAMSDAQRSAMKEKFLDASITLKLAMNAFDLIDKNKGERVE